MRNGQREEAWEELCDSPEQFKSLSETASLLKLLRDPRCSATFRRRLRRELLIRARAEGNGLGGRLNLSSVTNKIFGTGISWRRIGLPFAAAAVLFFVLTISYFGSAGFRPDEPAGAGGRDELLIGDIGDPFALANGREMPETPVAAPEERVAAGDAAAADPLQEGAPEMIKGQATDLPGAAGTEEEDAAPPLDGPAPPQPKEPDAAPALPHKPVFAVDRNLLDFKVAGNILLNYGPVADSHFPVDGIKFNWKPNNIAPASALEVQHFGTQEWARQLLSHEGFRVREEEVVEVKTQETKAGLFAEIIYRVSPALILHVHAEKGILAYFYEEKGHVAPKGYYRLLAPVDALQQLRAVRGPISGQQLHFSFQEVRLAYNDFLVEQDGVNKIVRLPAWCFTGYELHQEIEGVNFFLPAVQ